MTKEKQTSMRFWRVTLENRRLKLRHANVGRYRNLQRYASLFFEKQRGKQVRFWRDTLVNESQLVLSPGMNTKHLGQLKILLWKEHSGQPGDIPTSELVSLLVSLRGYLLSNTGDQLDEYPGSKPTGNLVRGHIERKRKDQNQ
mmetsp:Transcript_16354/g.29546  ORF Transcript_16354/g.29546 Transcript_16354/m.29546 type:complete len:143 (-) Transcript_16354:179-607(-)